MCEYRAVLFDLRGTLVDAATGWRLTDRERIRFLHAAGARASAAELRRLLAHAVAEVNQTARRSTAYFDQDCAVLQRAAAAVGVEIPRRRLAEFELWRNRGFIKSVRAFDDAAPTLVALRRLGVATGCVADGGTRWTQLALRRTGLASHLDVMVASEESSEVKATGGALRLALARLGVEPNDAVFIGDRLDKDVSMANRVGARGILLARSPGGQPPGVEAISTLRQALALPLRATAPNRCLVASDLMWSV